MRVNAITKLILNICALVGFAACNKSEVIMPEVYGLRPPTDGSSSYSIKVLEYVPAPGQFINNSMMGFAGENTQEAAVLYADRKLHSEDSSKRGLVSLGGFGGYITVLFDHSIQTSGGYGGYDFSITGNQFLGSSEPGVVWVMQDVNGNMLPDDGVWYELNGALYKESIKDYSVTYTRSSDGSDIVKWHDNKGAGGEISRNATHSQDYFPLWEKDEYTLTGTLLPDKCEILTDGRFSTGDYGWGYADSWGSDMLESPKQKNFFRISDALDASGNRVNLKYIDFIKVQTGVNVQGGAGIGELSTEVAYFKDENF